MAWDIPNPATPHYQPVTPEIPVAPREPIGERIGSALLTGMVRAAIAREQARLEQQRMVQQADQYAQQLGFEQKKQADDHAIAKENADTMERYRKDQVSMSGKTNDALKSLRQSQADLNVQKLADMKSGVLTAGKAQLEFAKTMASLHDDFMGRATELGAFDAKKRTTDPVGFADAVTALQTEFPGAPPGSGVGKQLSDLQKVADSQKTPMVINGKKTQLSYQQVLNGLRNPDTHDDYYQGLKDAGHIKSEQQDTGQVAPFSMQHPVDSVWNKLFSKTAKTTVPKPDLITQRVFEQQKTFDPATEKSRIPEDLPRSPLDLRARMMPTPQNIKDSQTGTVNSGLTPDPEPTDQDTYLQRAQAAIDAGKDESAVRAMVDQNGYDSSQLRGRQP